MVKLKLIENRLVIICSKELNEIFKKYLKTKIYIITKMANIIEYHDYKSLYFSIRNTFKVFSKEKIEETDFTKLGNKFH